MSDASTQTDGSGGRPFLPVAPSPGERRLPPPLAKLDQAALEQSAQVLGWRPKEEWQGDPAAFRDAKTFLEQAFTSDDDRIARNNLTQALGSHRQLQTQAQQTQAQLNEALETIKGLTTQFRAFTDRGYQRTREELDTQRTAAVAAGDTVEFQRLDKQLRELDESQRAAPAARVGAGGDQSAGGDQGTGGARTQPAQPAMPPDAAAAVAEWGRNNPWYFTDRDMSEYTDGYDKYLRATSPNSDADRAPHSAHGSGWRAVPWPDARPAASEQWQRGWRQPTPGRRHRWGQRPVRCWRGRRQPERADLRQSSQGVRKMPSSNTRSCSRAKATR